MIHIKRRVAALTLALALTACGTEPTPTPTPTPSPSPTPLTVSGTLTVGRGWFTWNPGEGCWGYGDGAAITPGAAVEILNPARTTIAIGRLDRGVDLHNPSEPGHYATGCQYPFTVTGVPSGQVSYTVRIASRLLWPMSSTDIGQSLSLEPSTAAVE